MKTLSLILSLPFFTPAFALLAALTTLDSGLPTWWGLMVAGFMGVFLALLFGGHEHPVRSTEEVDQTSVALFTTNCSELPPMIGLRAHLRFIRRILSKKLAGRKGRTLLRPKHSVLFVTPL